MKLKVKNLTFPVNTLWQALRQSNSKYKFSQVFENNVMLMVG